MKILVTGASGFIGGRFARFALEQGLDVRVNGRRAEGWSIWCAAAPSSSRAI
jgi:uncharacterized protein YbjT (DUF2867 family)